MLCELIEVYYMFIKYNLVNPNLFTMLVILQADTTHPLTKHRKIASSFRDSSLFDIFTLSCNLLKQVRIIRGLLEWTTELGI